MKYFNEIVQVLVQYRIMLGIITIKRYAKMKARLKEKFVHDRWSWTNLSYYISSVKVHSF